MGLQGLRFFRATIKVKVTWASRAGQTTMQTTQKASMPVFYKDWRGGGAGWVGNIGIIQGNIGYLGIMEKKMETTIEYIGL